jgi:hypothetical protein
MMRELTVENFRKEYELLCRKYGMILEKYNEETFCIKEVVCDGLLEQHLDDLILNNK